MNIRMLKTYTGPGTEFVDPQHSLIRFNNYLRDTLGIDKSVLDTEKILYCDSGDIYLIVGKKETGVLPVLHRSPASSDFRLLLSISL